MGKHKFYIVDVFAEEKFAGNQLAVFREGADECRHRQTVQGAHAKALRR